MGLGNDITLEIKGEIVNKNEFVFGEKINFIFNNITGMTNLNGKTYPGLSMCIVKNDKDTVYFNPNLISSLIDGTTFSPLQLQANFTTALPSQNNEKYRVYINIWDKKGTGKLSYELPFIIKHNDLLDINNNGIEYSNIYFWNETLKYSVVDNNLNAEHIFFLIFNDIEGLELINNMVYPILSLSLKDKNGNIVLANPNLLGDFDEEGINPKDLKNQVTAKITFTKGKHNNPYLLNVQLKDKNSSKKINVSSKLYIN